MSDMYWLTEEQMARLEPFLPKTQGKPRTDDRRVLSGITQAAPLFQSSASFDARPGWAGRRFRLGVAWVCGRKGFALGGTP